MGNRTATVVGGLSLLVLGAVLGVTVDRVWLAHHTPQIDGPELHKAALSFFHDELELDEHQVAEIHEVFMEHQPSIDSSWQKLRPQLLSAVDSVHAEIESVLTPEQRAHFKQWIAMNAEKLRHEVHAAEHLPGHVPEHE